MVTRSKRITRAVGPEELRGLLERPPRASLAFGRDGAIEAMPVAFRYEDGRYCFGVSGGDAGAPGEGPVALLIDDGCYHSELRGLSVRGRAVPVAGPPGADEALRWFEVVPGKVSAWHYGAMRDRESG